MGERVHLVIDGADGRAHCVELSEAAASEVRGGSILEIGRAEPPPRPADRTIAEFARGNGGTYEQALHLTIARDIIRPDGNHGGFVESHVRRLEALRRAGIVERLDAEHWRIPDDFEQRAGLRRPAHQAARRPRAVTDRPRRAGHGERRHLARPQPDQRRTLSVQPCRLRGRGDGRYGPPPAMADRAGLVREEPGRYIYQRKLLASRAGSAGTGAGRPETGPGARRNLLRPGERRADQWHLPAIRAARQRQIRASRAIPRIHLGPVAAGDREATGQAGLRPRPGRRHLMGAWPAAGAGYRHVGGAPQSGAGLPLVLAGKRSGPRRAVKAGLSRHRGQHTAAALTARLMRPGKGSPSTNGKSGSGPLPFSTEQLETMLDPAYIVGGSTTS